MLFIYFLSQKKNQPTKPSKELPVEKLNKKQEDKVDSRQPVKKDVEDKQKNPEKAKRGFSLPNLDFLFSEIKIPKVIRVILTILLGFGYFLWTIIWCNVIVEANSEKFFEILKLELAKLN